MELTLYNLAKEVAEKALNEITYEGKTLREWVEIIVKQQPCEDCINREALINELKLGYFNKDLQEAKNDPCVVDAMIDWAIRTVKSQPSFTPKTSCEVCREQVLKHLEKEDWADTVNCVMNMPFMKRQECINDTLDKISAEIMQLDYDIETVDYDYNDMAQTEVVHMICREEVLQIIDKYKAESEVNDE